MVHQGQGLALGLEAGDHLLGVHPELDQLERDPAAHRLGLFGEVDDPHAALAERVEDLVGADLLGKVGGAAGVAVGRGSIQAQLQQTTGVQTSRRRIRGQLVSTTGTTVEIQRGPPLSY
jgi:hypothetical protein